MLIYKYSLRGYIASCTIVSILAIALFVGNATAVSPAPEAIEKWKAEGV